MTSAFGIDHGDEIAKALPRPSIGGLKSFARGVRGGANAGGHRAAGPAQLPKPSVAGAKSGLRSLGQKAQGFAVNRPATTVLGAGALGAAGGALAHRRKQ